MVIAGPTGSGLPPEGVAVSRPFPALVLALSLVSGPLAAQQLPDPAGDGRIGNWKIGGLAYSLGEPAVDNRVSDLLQDKVRIGSPLVPQLAPYASVRPWLAPGPAAVDGPASGVSGLRGGILIDVPLGSFVFTPSFGAGTLPRTIRDPAGSREFRSQLELGYEFDNKSRFSLGYSRIATDGNPGEGSQTANNVFGLYYRLPFGGQ